MKDLFKRIGNILNNLKEKVAKTSATKLAAGFVAATTALWMTFLVILNIINAPYLLVYLLFILPLGAVLISLLSLTLGADSSTSYSTSSIIAHITIAISVLLSGNIAFAVIYGMPLLLQNMCVYIYNTNDYVVGVA